MEQGKGPVKIGYGKQREASDGDQEDDRSPERRPPAREKRGPAFCMPVIEQKQKEGNAGGCKQAQIQQKEYPAVRKMRLPGFRPCQVSCAELYFEIFLYYYLY